jgi:hypothetical protein
VIKTGYWPLENRMHAVDIYHSGECHTILKCQIDVHCIFLFLKAHHHLHAGKGPGDSATGILTEKHLEL